MGKQTTIDVSAPSPAFYLDRLPPEILRIICKGLPANDILSIRYQSKYLCEIASPYFLHEVDVRFKKSSVESLLELSKHPTLSYNVETIIYTPDKLTRQSRWEWEQGIRVLAERSSAGPSPPPPKQLAPEREWRLFHRNLGKVCRPECYRLTSQELDVAWSIQQKYLREQDAMIAQDYASRDLLQAFRGFQNLSAVYVNYDCGLWPRVSSVNPYSDGLCNAGSGGVCDYRDDSIWGLKEAMSLMNMLGDADLRLQSFGIGTLNWRFFQELGDKGVDNALFGKMKQLVGSLKSLDIVMTRWSNLLAMESPGLEHELCCEFLERGVLGRFVAAAPDLHKLAVAFDVNEMMCPLNFKHLVLNTHWPCLHALKLDSIQVYRSDWILFFERHAITIKHLSLGRIMLVEGEWIAVLEQMQQLLTLDEMVFQSSLGGYHPTRCWLEEPGLLSSDDDRVRANRLRWALEDFMVYGGVYPLLDY